MKILHFHRISLVFHKVFSVTTINSTVACLNRIGPRVKFLDDSRWFPYFAKLNTDIAIYVQRGSLSCCLVIFFSASFLNSFGVNSTWLKKFISNGYD